MSLLSALCERSQNRCELSGAEGASNVVVVPPKTEETLDNCILVCDACFQDIQNKSISDTNLWRCLNDSMWSTHAPVQVMSAIMLNRLSAETWAQELSDMLYLEEDNEKWLKQALIEENKEPTFDVNGVALNAGDNITLIKDLDVKGAGFTAKRGTAVRGISLTDNPKHIEGRVNGQRIVIIAEYVKKS